MGQSGCQAKEIDKTPGARSDSAQLQPTVVAASRPVLVIVSAYVIVAALTGKIG